MIDPRPIFRLLTPAERRAALALLGLTLLGMVLEAIGVGLAVPAVVILIQSDIAHAYPKSAPLLRALGNPTQVQLIVAGMAGLVALYFFKGIYLGYLYWRQTRFAFSVQANLSERLFTVYLHQPYTFHLQRNSAQLIQNAVGEVGLFTFTAMLPGLVLVTDGLTIMGISALLMIVQPLATMVVVALLVLSAWSFDRLIRVRIDRAALARQRHDALRMQHLQQGLGGAKEVKLFGRETEFLSRYAFHNRRTAKLVQLGNALQQVPRLWLELLGVIALAVVVLVTLARGRPPIEILPALGLFSAAAFRLMPSMTRVITSLQALRSAAPIVRTLGEELELAIAATPQAPSRQPRAPLNSHLRLAGVTFTYAGAAVPALADVSVRIGRGESIGFVGPSGSGKSTLVDVILGLLPPDQGRVEADDVDIRADLRGWQDQIGYVPQTIFLTDDTLRRNVAFGLADQQIDDASVARALKAAQLDAFVASLPNGWDTEVGERGVRLSGGQRQRIGIARALYHDPVVLVLDEATSALDSATERDVMQAVAALHGRKTLIIVAHRLSTLEHCDRLYCLDGGRVVVEGTPGDIIVPGQQAATPHV